MGVVSMATDYSIETKAKLLKANQPETDTLWVLCVYVCVLLETGCFHAAPEVVTYTCLNWCPLRLNITGGYAYVKRHVFLLFNLNVSLSAKCLSVIIKCQCCT